MVNKKQAVIITAYKGIDELRFLLQTLSDDFLCYVNIDKKSADLFKDIELEFNNVFFQFPYDVKWGGYEHLNAILDLLTIALSDEWSYAHIISGEDIPIEKNDEFYRRLNGKTDIYMDSNCYDEFYGRRWKFYWPYVRFSNDYKKPVIRRLNLALIAIQYIFLHPRRKHIGEFTKIYYGFIWGTYPRDSIEYILNYMKSNPQFIRELRWCKIPEEICFQTILNNSNYKNRIANNNLRFWTMQKGSWGPNYLSVEDIDKIKESDALFARKMKIGTEATDLIIKEIKDDFQMKTNY